MSCIVLDLDSTLLYMFSNTKMSLVTFLQSCSTTTSLQQKRMLLRHLVIYLLSTEEGTSVLIPLVQNQTYPLQLQFEAAISLAQEHDNKDLYMWGFLRPNVHEFLQTCFDLFKYVIVFTAAEINYANTVVTCLFPDAKNKPFRILAGEKNCIFTRSRSEPQIVTRVHKPLDHIFEDPQCPEDLHLERTFVVDDNPHTFSHIPNSIQIPSFHPRPLSVTGCLSMLNDNCLLKLKYWFIRRVFDHEWTRVDTFFLQNYQTIWEMTLFEHINQ